MAIGRIVANIFANTAGFSKGTSRARKDLKTFDKSLADSAKSVAKWGAAVGVAAGAAFGALVRQGLQAVDAQAKMARSIDASIGALEGLERAAKDAGVASGQASQAAQRLQQSLGEARRGTGEAAAALQDLGLRAADLAAMDVDERFATLSDRMNEAGYTSDQMSDSLRRMGIRSKEMVLLMRDGGDAIRDASAEMAGYGLAIDSVDAAMIENLNDQLDRASDVWRGITNQLAVHAAPAIQAIVDLFGDASKETDGFTEQSEKLIQWLVKGAGLAADAFQGLRMVFTALRGGFQAWLTFVLEGFSTVVNTIDGLVNNAIKRVNWMIDQVNKIRGVNLGRLVERGGPSDFAWMIEQMAGDSRKAMEDLFDDLADMSGDMPSERLNAAYKAALAQRDELGKEHEEREKERMQRLLEADLAAERKKLEERARLEAERQQREEEAERARLMSSLERLEHHLRDERERLEHAYKQRQEALRELRDSELDIDFDYYTMSEKLRKEHEEALERIKKDGADQRERVQEASMSTQISIVIGGLNRMSSQMDRQNRAIFAMNQILGVGNAAISAYVGINAALAKGAAGIPEAIAIGAAAFGNVASIAAMTYGGKGGTGGANMGGGMGGGMGAGGMGGGGGGPSQTLTVSGIDPSALFSGEVVESLVEEIRQFQAAGGRLA